MAAVTVIGAGDMGSGFAVQFVRTGQRVTLVDHRQSNLDEARERIREAAAFLHDRGSLDATADEVVDAVDYTLDRDAGVSDADVVLETVSEDLQVKREVFRAVADAAPDDAVLASNTSGIPITDIAEGLDAADRIAGCHWWYPPYLLEPVEVVRGEQTAEETMDRLSAFVESVDRNPVRVEKDVPGFLWNRVQMAVFRECCHLVESGVASAEDVNAAIRDGYATRTAAIGPFETIDIAGLDLVREVLGNVSPHLDDSDDPSPLFDEFLGEGRSGIEAGAGFFEYDRLADAVRTRRDRRVAAVRDALGAEED